MTYNTRVTYTGNGTQTDFSIPFSYSSSTEVKVVRLDTGASLTFTLPTTGVCRLDSAPANGVEFVIYRDTDAATAVVNWTTNSNIRSTLLNSMTQQFLKVVQEVKDAVAGALDIEVWSNSAAASATAAANQLTDFKKIYYGAYATDPTLRPNGTARITGDMYYNSTTFVMKVFNGSSWDIVAPQTTNFLQKANNLSDLTNAATARTNLGLSTLAATGNLSNATGTLGAANGGTGQTTYAVGDLLYASATNAIGKLADVATGNVLISGGVGVAPAWGKVGLTTHVSGTLGVANGGTGVATLTGMVKGNGTGAFTAATVGTDYAQLVRGTAVNTTSGTSIDITGIPSWAKRVTVVLKDVSTNGTSQRLLQLGSGTIATTGYGSMSGIHITGSSIYASVNGLVIASTGASDTVMAVVQLYNISGNVWVCGVQGTTGSATITGGGSATLSGVLDRIRLTTVNGTDAFDGGSINIFYE